MNPRPTSWSRLVAAARLIPADRRDTAAPLGFATRICALAPVPAEPTFGALFARFSLRALGACALVMVLGVMLNFGSVLNAFEGEPATALNDPVAEWLDAAS